MIKTDISKVFPLLEAPLVHCITNEVTCETVANALLYIGAKPIMASDRREFDELFQQTDSLLLNIGHLSEEREESLVAAAKLANKSKKPTVVDLVGYGVSQTRNQVGQQLAAEQPTVIKGNSSELRHFCGLSSQARGVDSSALDQNPEALDELSEAMQALTKRYPKTIFLATGSQDLIVENGHQWRLTNGVASLDRFTGTGDIVGALIAALLGGGIEPIVAVIAAVSYFNRCGEQTEKTAGLAAFRQATLDQLSLLMEKNWWTEVRGWEK